MNRVRNLNICPLCAKNSEKFCKAGKALYFRCAGCRGIFLSKDYHLPEDMEKKRYLEHNNDVEDPRYRKFAEPAADYILDNFSPSSAGLDFGAGTGPVISSLLTEKGFGMSLYDPFFHRNTKCLDGKYDFIIASEVMEHFKDPCAEFRLLEKMLKSPGKLVCRTHLYQEGDPFESWYYRKDPTHVFFYTEKTLDWIKEAFRFSGLAVYEKLIIFEK